jgi:nitrous oxide reductase accessory protein NosL
MFVAPHPTWIAVVVFDDGSRASFDGPKDMFRFLLDLETYQPGTSRDRVAEVWVKDYYTTRWIDARSASFVLGTDVLGPMGRELVPVSTTDAAVTLLEDHGGQRILAFDQVTVDQLP